MRAWTAADLRRIAGTDDLHVSPFRADGVTYGTPTWIWSVVVHDQLFVRAYHGVASRWYRAAIAQRAGRIRAAGGEWEVSFAPVEGEVQQAIDAAYEEKYAGHVFLRLMVGPKARAATLVISPR